MFGDPVDNPKGWSIKTLEELGDFKNGLNYRKATGYTVKCLSVRDFKDRREISGVDVLSDISISVKPSREYLLRDGDIVFVRSNGNSNLTGRCLAVYPHGGKAVFSGFCIRFRLAEKQLNADYLLDFFKSESIRKAIQGRGPNIKNISQPILASLKVPLPPLSLQQEFADFAAEADKSQFALEQEVDALSAERDALLDRFLA